MVAKTQPVGQRSAARSDRRQAILDAATELFAQRGFAGVTIQEIADAASTHKTTVLYHFPNKEALYAAVIDEALSRIEAVMREFLAAGFGEERLRERVAYLIDQIQAYFAGHLAHARLLERELVEVASPTAYPSHFVERVYMPALAGLEHAMASGFIRPVDPAFLIHDLHVQLIGYFCHRPLLERLRGGDPYTIEALIARRNHLVEQIFSLLRPGDATPS